MANQIHRVTAGETLASIAKKYGMTMQQIRQNNPHLTQSSGTLPRTNSGSQIYIGDEVRIKGLFECARNLGSYLWGCRNSPSNALNVEFGVKVDATVEDDESTFAVGAELTFGF